MARGTTDRAAAWVYGGIWAVLTRWFHVPQDPPLLPTHPGEQCEAFQPSAGFLRLLKLKFWIALVAIDALIVIPWLVLLFTIPLLAVLLAIPAFIFVVAPDIIAYVAIHLRYDTTWYVMSGRSIRIRRGIWVIQETTITFENVQNVKVLQGPVERFFGIGNVIVETAGGGGGTAGHGKHQFQGPHVGVIEGIADAQRIRDVILSRVRESTSAGLGDDDHHPSRVNRTESPAMRSGKPAWSAEHVAVLREIRDQLAHI
jgi:membrane protein YdbS with pleckstrin-like domain